MEVVKNRNKWQGQFECAQCHALLVVSERDVKYRVIMEGDSFRRGNYYFDCGECGDRCSLGEFGPEGLIWPVKEAAVKEYEDSMRRAKDMTEKEKMLELVIKFFMEKAERMWKSKNEMEVVHASQWHGAAIDSAGLGAFTGTIDWAARKYLENSASRLFGHDNFSLAVAMILQGASKEVAEEAVKVAISYHGIRSFENLITYIGRPPKEEEFISLVKAEVDYTATISETYHDLLIEFAKKHFDSGKVKEVKEMLAEKTREFNRHSD